MRTILFKGLPNIPFSARLTSPLFLTLPPPPPFHTFVMLSLSLRGHTVTLFTGSHAGVKCVWMQMCVPLFLFCQIPLTTILAKSESARALKCTHRHVNALSCWVQFGQQSVNKCAFMYLACAFILCPSYRGAPRCLSACVLSRIG